MQYYIARDRPGLADFLIHVRVLLFDYRRQIDDSAVALTWPVWDERPLLPQLVELVLILPQEHENLVGSALHKAFAHRGLSAVSVHGISPATYRRPDASIALLRLMRDLAARAPAITSLRLEASGGSLTRQQINAACALSVAPIFDERIFPELQRVELSPIFFNRLVLDSFVMDMGKSTRPPVTEILAIDYHRENPFGIEGQEAHCVQAGYFSIGSRDAGDYLDLKAYTAFGTATEAAALLNRRDVWDYDVLSSLFFMDTVPVDPNLHRETFTSNADVGLLFSTITTRCDHLTSLYINLDNPFLFRYYDFDAELDVGLDERSLAPLQCATSLESLVLISAVALSLTQSQLFGVLRPLKRLTRLILCPTPRLISAYDDDGQKWHFSPQTSTFTTETMGLVLDMLPKLDYLGMYLDLSEAKGNGEVRRGAIAGLSILDLGHSPPPPGSCPSQAFWPYIKSDAGASVTVSCVTRHHLGSRHPYFGPILQWTHMVPGKRRYRDEMEYHQKHHMVPWCKWVV